MELRKPALLVPLFGFLLAAVACSVQKVDSAVPAQAKAPTLGPPSASASPAAAPQTTVPDAHALEPPRPDAVAELLERVEKEYLAAQDQYQAGQVEAAKQSLDRAFQLLLLSSFNVHDDERLEREFERLDQAADKFNIAPVSEGESSSVARKAEPAPIDEANEISFPADPNIKAKAEAEIRSTRSDLPLMMTDQVAGYINYFSSRGRPTITNALIRSGRYEDMIRRTLREEGVPQDLIYLAQAESGFHPLALSRAGARGMWQFMGSRAKGYGLERNFWIDERQDPEKATRAAARHLKDLYNQFGDWYLAMAAYNSGPGTVQSAVRRTGYADFWQLYRRNVLPKETRNYVPIIVAVTIMAKNPEQYGLDDIVRDKPLAYDPVKIDYPVDLRLAADCSGASLADVLDLNPSLLRYVTPKDREFELRLPAGSKDKFVAAISAIPTDMRAWWRYHTVQSGESLASIARAYRTSSKAIFTANELETEELTSGQRLIIPISPGKNPAGEDGMIYARRTTRYKVRPGDTVLSVSENLGIPPRMIRSWNRIKGDSLKGRRVLYVHLPVSPAAAREVQQAKSSPSSRSAHAAAATSETSVVRHKVKRGETLTSIASSYNTTVSALKRANANVATATLRPGMVLVIRP